MKKNEKLLDAVGNIDDRMIDAAYNKESKRRDLSGVFEAVGAVAAVAAVAVFAVVLSHFAQKDTNISVGDTTAAAGDSDTDTDHNTFICGDQKVLGLEGLICDSYEQNGQHIEVDGYGISQEL
ncbi:MAG: hypothetical protein J5879_02440, partial [Clostridia bacterium]|nr:hypothetical protein [Clostridia bacterium]